MNLARAFFDSARRICGRPRCSGATRSFLTGNSGRARCWVADRLTHDFGVKPGDRVGIWLKNCPEFIPAFFGILQAGAVVVPINNFLKPDEVQFILGDAGIDTLITDAGMPDALDALRNARPQLRDVARGDDYRRDGCPVIHRRTCGNRPSGDYAIQSRLD